MSNFADPEKNQNESAFFKSKDCNLERTDSGEQAVKQVGIARRLIPERKNGTRRRTSMRLSVAIYSGVGSYTVRV